ncbi:MAG: exopolyphosphatase [Trueperella sp.]|nr:exopolyphosphatase [Trueperella sp.]
MRVAGIDAGTNSIRLLIADVAGPAAPSKKALSDVVRRMEISRLGQGVDRTGKLAPDALERTLHFVAEYAQQCQEYGVESIRFAATSATRDAANREEFTAAVRHALGVDPQVLSGEEEARTTFAGAISIHRDCPDPMLAVDLGGGSTELVLGTADGEILSSFSMDVGSVRMRERHLLTDPPTAAQIAAARADIQAELARARQVVDFSQARTLVGLAGTVTSVTAKFLGLTSYDPAAIDGTFLTFDQIDTVCDWYLSVPAAERAKLGFMHPGRVDVIGAGALVWQELCRAIASETAESAAPILGSITSEHDILDGLALWAAAEPNPPRWQ